MPGLEVADGIRGLIFDCDGTLADTMPFHLKAWEAAFTAAGHQVPAEFLDSLKGMAEMEIVELINERFSLDLDPTITVAAKHEVFRVLLQGVQPIAPVVELAERYRRRLPMAVASGSTRENVTTTLKKLGLSDLFSVVLTAEDVTEHKPSPAMFLKAARHLGVDPGACQVFEDGDLGLEAARRAGMTGTDVREFIG